MNGEGLAKRLVTDELWDVVEPLLPKGRSRPQGGGRPRADDRAVFTAITFVLTSGCSWRALPGIFGVTSPTAHRRFVEWTARGLWKAVDERVREQLGNGSEAAWTAVLRAAAVDRSGLEDVRPPSPAEPATRRGEGRQSARAAESRGRGEPARWLPGRPAAAASPAGRGPQYRIPARPDDGEVIRQSAPGQRAVMPWERPMPPSGRCAPWPMPELSPSSAPATSPTRPATRVTRPSRI